MIMIVMAMIITTTTNNNNDQFSQFFARRDLDASPCARFPRGLAGSATVFGHFTLLVMLLLLPLLLLLLLLLLLFQLEVK